ncbi:MAG: choice-of-anchor J domain-containing protein [Balneolales bacterium]|nr:choice-of-anchor J domain-containing protein [Balneolales bacterium]
MKSPTFTSKISLAVFALGGLFLLPVFFAQLGLIYAQLADNNEIRKQVSEWDQNNNSVTWLNSDIVLQPYTSVHSGSGPLVENFESTMFPPLGWSRLPETDEEGQSWFRNSPSFGAHTGDFSAQSASWLPETGPLTADNWLITPRLSVSAAENTINFFARSICAGFQDPLTVYVSTAGKDLIDFKDQVFNIPALPNEWTSYDIDLSFFEGLDVYVAFHHQSEDQCSVLLDTIQGPSLFQPTGPGLFAAPALSFGTRFNLGASTMPYQITNNGGAPLVVNESSSDARLTLSGLPVTIPAGESRTINVTLNTDALSGGYYSANFNLSTNDPENSIYTVNTTALIVEAVFSDFLFENFNSVPSREIPAGWTGNFQVRTFGGKEDSHRLTRRFDQRAAFQSSEFTTSFVSLGTNPVLSFYYRIVNFEEYVANPVAGDATSIDFQVVISTDNTETFDVLWTYDPLDHNVSLDYANITIDLSNYADETAVIGIVGTWNSGEVYLDIDDLMLGTIPAVPEFAINPEGTFDFGELDRGLQKEQVFTVTNTSGSVLSVLSAEIAGANEDEFLLDGFTGGNLEFNETISFSVLFSPTFGGPKSAQLLVNYNDGEEKTETVNLVGIGLDPSLREPFREDFTSVPPPNWELRYGLLEEETTFVDFPAGNLLNRWVLDNFYGNALNGTSARANLYVGGPNFPPLKWWLITPTINLDDFEDDAYLKFDLGLTLWGQAVPSQLASNSYFGVIISEDNGSTWSSNNIIFEKDGANQDLITPTGETFTIDLSAYSGEIKIGFYIQRLSGASPDQRFHLANVGVHQVAQEEMIHPGWNVMSLPAGNIRIRELAAQNHVQGVPGLNEFYGTNGYDEGSPNIYLFNNVADDNGGTHPGWQAPQSVNTRIQSGQGFIWFFYQNPGPFVTELPFDFSASGLQPSMPVERTLNTEDNFTLLGNPFPTTLTTAGISGPIQANVQVWNPVAGQFEAQNSIPPFTGFFVEKTSDGVVVMEEQNPILRGISKPMISFSLTGVNNEGVELGDNSVKLLFTDDAEHGWDRFDLSKIRSLNYTAATLSVLGDRNGEVVHKVIDSRPLSLHQEFEVDLALDITNFSGLFELSAEISDLPDDWGFTLTDNKTGEVVDLRTGVLTFNHESAAPNTALNPDEMLANFTTSILSSDSRFTLQVVPSATGIDTPGDLPERFALKQNYPNPFNPITNIQYELPETGQVRIEIYNVMGQRIATLVNGIEQAGVHTVSFDASALSSGTYLYRITAGAYTETRKMMLIK